MTTATSAERTWTNTASWIRTSCFANEVASEVKHGFPRGRCHDERYVPRRSNPAEDQAGTESLHYPRAITGVSCGTRSSLSADVDFDDTMFDNILVPTDGSECAEVAIGYAQDLASRYEATVHVLCVVDSRSLEGGSHYDRIREEHTEIAERTCSELSDSDLSVEQAVRTDVPHTAILGYAAEQDIDLIVMGSHGRTGLERFLLGASRKRS